MATECAVIQVLSPSSTGTQTYSIGFQPKMLIIISTGVTVTVDSVLVTYMFGASDGTTQNSIAWCGTPGASNYRARRQFTTNFINVINTAGTTTHVANVSAIGATSIDVNWTTAGASGTIFEILAIGGSDITNAKVLDITTAAGTGNQAITGVGFQPDLFMAAGAFTTNTTLASSGIYNTFAIATASSTQGLSSFVQDSVTTLNCSRRQGNNIFYSTVDASETTAQAGTLTSLDADGATINWSTASSRRMIGIFLKGGQYSLSSVTANTTTGAQNVTSIGFQPKGIFHMSACLTSNSTATEALTNLGVCDASLSQGSISYSGQDGATWSVTSATRRLITTTTVIDSCAFNTGTRTFATANISAMLSNGFTYNWTTKDANAYLMQVLAIGDNAVPPTPSTGRRYVPRFRYMLKR